MNFDDLTVVAVKACTPGMGCKERSQFLIRSLTPECNHLVLLCNNFISGILEQASFKLMHVREQTLKLFARVDAKLTTLKTS